MQAGIAIEQFTEEQRDLWSTVDRLWSQSRSRDSSLIGLSLHPQYVGWDTSADLPHNKEAAIKSVTGETPALQSYSLFPHSVQVYDHVVGVVHYSYSATVRPHAALPIEVTGKWTEVYLRQGHQWTMVAVSGRPDSPLVRQGVQTAA